MKIYSHRLTTSSKIAREMYLRLTITVVMPVLIVGIFLVKYSCNTLYNQSLRQIESDNLRVKSILTDCLINIYNLSEDVINDHSLQEYLMDQGTDVPLLTFPESSYTQIDSILARNTSISSLHIYTTNPYKENGSYISYATSQIHQECFSKADIPGSTLWGLYPSVNYNKDNPELTLIRSFPLTDSHYPSIIVITVNSNYLRNRIQNNNLSTMLAVNKSNIFFSTIRSLQETPMPVYINYDKKYYSEKGVFQFKEKKTFGFISSLPVYNTEETLYIYTIDTNARGQMFTVGIISGGITFGVIIVALLGIIFYTSYLSKRIVSLKTSMKRARDGNYDVIIDSLKGDDELTETFEDLKYIIKDIKIKNAKMYEAQLKEQEFITEQSKMRYKLLSNQINPHFIYNTLETIRMLALEADATEVADATMLLAKAMRHVLDHTMVNSTTLEKELDYVFVYLQIQKIRFENRLEYSITIDPSIHPSNSRILPILLQPIVENAVIHGLESITHKVYISITVERVDTNNMLIKIEDNGKGMTFKEIEELNQKLTQKSGNTPSNIGLYNIRSRIQLFYGPKYDMTITSLPGVGTTVSLFLPFIINTEDQESILLSIEKQRITP